MGPIAATDIISAAAKGGGSLIGGGGLLRRKPKLIVGRRKKISRSVTDRTTDFTASSAFGTDRPDRDRSEKFVLRLKTILILFPKRSQIRLSLRRRFPVVLHKRPVRKCTLIISAGELPPPFRFTPCKHKKPRANPGYGKRLLRTAAGGGLRIELVKLGFDALFPFFQRRFLPIGRLK